MALHGCVACRSTLKESTYHRVNMKNWIVIDKYHQSSTSVIKRAIFHSMFRSLQLNDWTWTYMDLFHQFNNWCLCFNPGRWRPGGGLAPALRTGLWRACDVSARVWGHRKDGWTERIFLGGITWVCDDFCIYVPSSIKFKGFPDFPLNASIAWMMLPYSWAQVRVVQNRIRNSRQRFEAAKQEAAEDNTVTTWVRYGSQWYGSIPINTIFNGMNIHKSQLFWCELQGYKVLTHCLIIYPNGSQKMPWSDTKNDQVRGTIGIQGEGTSAPQSWS